MNCAIETSNDEQLYLEMEENIFIVAGHKLLDKLSVNLFFTSLSRERKRELPMLVWFYWVFKI
jgi:hypothetical protein